MRIIDWSSDVCSSDLRRGPIARDGDARPPPCAVERPVAGDETEMTRVRLERVRHALDRARRDDEILHPDPGRVERGGRSDARRVGTRGVSTHRTRLAA